MKRPPCERPRPKKPFCNPLMPANRVHAFEICSSTFINQPFSCFRRTKDKEGGKTNKKTKALHNLKKKRTHKHTNQRSNQRLVPMCLRFANISQVSTKKSSLAHTHQAMNFSASQIAQQLVKANHADWIFAKVAFVITERYFERKERETTTKNPTNQDRAKQQLELDLLRLLASSEQERSNHPFEQELLAWHLPKQQEQEKSKSFLTL